ncbi:MAG: hypothetical protein ACJ785_07325 [Gemmatimonadaceae bacterium]
MYTTMFFALLQVSPQSPPAKSIFQQAITDRYALSVTEAVSNSESVVKIVLTERKGRLGSYAFPVLSDKGGVYHKVLRADSDAVVISRETTYTNENSVKIFLHPTMRGLRKEIEYAADVGLAAVDDREVSAVLDVPLEIVTRLEVKPPWISATEDASYLPSELRDHPMPVSSYAEFARARPKRVRDGYDKAGTHFEEKPGPYQIAGNRIWFGKVFYDGESLSGVGGVGYFDKTLNKYSFAKIPELVDWSTSALVLDDGTIWAGLVTHPEGADIPGGLIRHDFKTGATRKFPIEEVVLAIVRWKDRVYVATVNGAYRLDDAGAITRYRVEPNINNRFILIGEKVRVPR